MSIVSKPCPTTGSPSAGVTMAPLLSGRQRAEFLVGVGAWLVAQTYFWSWWFKPAHYTDFVSFTSVTLIMAWVTLLPGYFLFAFNRGCRPVGPLRLPAGSRAAMVVTKAPSEPFSVVSHTLKAMLAQDVPHDTWLADEDPSSETLEWCRRHGVRVSTRRGRTDYHRATWPRRTRCKEGNLAFFYDHYGYRLYDFVVQLDADHVPDPGYLNQMLVPFADTDVGYVSAPSICDRNAGESWSARGRLYAEASMHGSLQAGYNGGLAPLCIGSHYAVRTAALKEIGGLGPELAEDHSTTLMMNAFGWRGVHAIDAIAHGDGPRTFADLVTQEFQWSRSLVTILLQFSPIYVPRLPLRLKCQFIFAQLWYPLFAIFMAAMFLMPIVALLRGAVFAGITYPAFLAHFTPLSAVLVLMAFGWRNSGTFRPVDARIFSWEAMLFLFARWPWALAGTIAAIRDWATGSFVDFRVTPKGNSEVAPLPYRVLAPYAVLSIASALPAIMVNDAGQSRGFFIFAIVNAVLYALLLVVIVVRHARENTVRVSTWSYRPVVAAALALLVFMPGLAGYNRGMEGLQSLAWGTGRLSLFETKFAVAGAGVGGADLQRIRFNPRWLPTEEAKHNSFQEGA